MLVTISLIAALIVMIWQAIIIHFKNNELDRLDEAAFTMAEELLRLGSPLVYVVEEE